MHICCCYSVINYLQLLHTSSYNLICEYRTFKAILSRFSTYFAAYKITEISSVLNDNSFYIVCNPCKAVLVKFYMVDFIHLVSNACYYAINENSLIFSYDLQISY